MAVTVDGTYVPPLVQLQFMGDEGGVDPAPAPTAPTTSAARPPLTPSSHVAVLRNMRPASASASASAASSPKAYSGPGPAPPGDWARTAADISMGRVRPSYGAGPGAMGRSGTDVSGLALTGVPAAGLPPSPTSRGAGEGGASGAWAPGAPPYPLASSGGDRGAAPVLAPAPSKWEVYVQQSTVVGRVGDWQERRMNRSGDVFFFHPATGRGAYHLEGVGERAVLGLEHRVLPPAAPGVSKSAVQLSRAGDEEGPGGWVVHACLCCCGVGGVGWGGG
jgi:hypothetical protein